MKLRLVSHVNRDGDLLEAWFRYYLGLGITSFHLIVHGPREENTRLFELKDRYPVTIEDSYEGPFHSDEKKRRLDILIGRLTGQWIVLADSDEFVEFPYRGIPTTIRMLGVAGANLLFAPMVQHLTIDGSLESPDVVEDPFRTFPLCSVDLYDRMGVRAEIKKYPLFYCTERTALRDAGNHNPQTGDPASVSSLQGVTHHFKFRRAVAQRLDDRINSSHPWRHESVQYQQFLESHANRLPTEGAFPYSRSALFHRGLLRKFTLKTGLNLLRRAIGGNSRG